MRITHSSDFELRKPALHQSWADWIAVRDWQLFITFTFKDSVHPELAERYLYKFFRRQNKRYYGQRYEQKAVQLVYVAGLEYQKRGAIHFHALVANVPADYRIETGLDDWMKCGGHAGRAKIERIEHLSDVVFYVTKYVTKEGEILLSPHLHLQRLDSDDSGRKVTPLDF